MTDIQNKAIFLEAESLLKTSSTKYTSHMIRQILHRLCQVCLWEQDNASAIYLRMLIIKTIYDFSFENLLIDETF